MGLFAYKMTNDLGFAPNPFWGYLTLATCKSMIRRHKRAGDWIAGFTSKTLCGHEVGEERLVFLMQIEEKIELAKYYRDPRFRPKIPKRGPAGTVYKRGDNIYKPLVRNPLHAQQFCQLPWGYHGKERKFDDLNGQYALIATRFAYFGVESLQMPPNVRPDVPAGQSAHGTETHDLAKAMHFINYVFEKTDVAVMARPHQWPSSDTSWKPHTRAVTDGAEDDASDPGCRPPARGSRLRGRSRCAPR